MQRAVPRSSLLTHQDGAEQRLNRANCGFHNSPTECTDAFTDSDTGPHYIKQSGAYSGAPVHRP